MTKEELSNALVLETYLLRKGVRPASYLYNFTDSNMEHLLKFCEGNSDIKFFVDPLMEGKIWLFRNECVGVLLNSMYRMNYDAKEVLMGLLLGYSAEEEESWLEHVRENRESYDYILWGY